MPYFGMYVLPSSECHWAESDTHYNLWAWLTTPHINLHEVRIIIMYGVRMLILLLMQTRTALKKQFVSIGVASLFCHITYKPCSLMDTAS